MPKDSTQTQNKRNLAEAMQRLEEKILRELEENDFFTSTLTITVQNGVVKIAKTAIENCEHFTARA